MFVIMVFLLFFPHLFFQAGETELLWVMRISIFIIGALATVLGLVIKSVYALWFLCSDFVFVMLFPQLFCVVYFSGCNTYGSLAGYIVGFLLRILGGEAVLKIPPVIKYPMYHDEHGQLFPFRTFAMCISFITILAVSYPLRYAFLNGIIPKEFDFFHCVVNIPEIEREKYEDVEGENMRLKSLREEQGLDPTGMAAAGLQREKLLDIGDIGRTIIPESASKEPLREDSSSPSSPEAMTPDEKY